MKKILVIGSTGSIGKNTIKVAQRLKGFEIVGLAAKNNYKALLEQSRQIGCKKIAIFNRQLRDKVLRLIPSDISFYIGLDGLFELFEEAEPDLIVCANTGIETLEFVLHAIKSSTQVAIANKEIIVAAGKILTDEAKKNNITLIPVDSEHSAIFQCLLGYSTEDLRRVVLTASGGPFRGKSLAKIAKADAKSALLHPTWSMGIKNTIDSATLMNKALEIVEARFLFNLLPKQIEVIIHPQSVIHSIVEFIDGSMLAQMSPPDMKFPIQYALTYPERVRNTFSKPFDFAKFASLTFEEPDREKFPSLDFAYSALKEGGTMPAVMNAANEVAVEKFLRAETNIPGIWRIIEKTMKQHKTVKEPDLEDIISADREARIFAKGL